MPRLYNIGAGHDDAKSFVPTIKKVNADKTVTEYVKVPTAFTGGADEFVEHKPGNVYVPIDSHGFYTVPKGGYFDVPHGCSALAVKNIAPHLVDEAEYIQATSSGAASVASAKEAPALSPKTSKEK